ncbi:hypothetical protein C8J56DRAFT_322416 [Mycena floridula]|nr:hypothetical protein C8J56DRAFT_322416 [Mycena floridula]
MVFFVFFLSLCSAFIVFSRSSPSWLRLCRSINVSLFLVLRWPFDLSFLITAFVYRLRICSIATRLARCRNPNLLVVDALCKFASPSSWSPRRFAALTDRRPQDADKDVVCQGVENFWVSLFFLASFVFFSWPTCQVVFVVDLSSRFRWWDFWGAIVGGIFFLRALRFWV